MKRTVIHNARIVTPRRIFEGYVVIAGRFIAEVVEGAAPAELLAKSDVTAIDAGKDYLMAGAIDTHVHFREPGMETKGDMATESAAALAGGVTSILEMPNTRPATTTAETWRDKMRRAAGRCRTNYGFFIGATDSNLDELRAMDYSRCPGVKLFLGSSTGGMLMDSDDMIAGIFSTVKAPVVVHAEDEKRIQSRLADARDKAVDGDLPTEFHSEIRDSEACLIASRRIVDLARRHGGRLHLAHLSTEAELTLLDNSETGHGKKITAETCPQYLLLDSDNYGRLGSRMKCNPAIKSSKDRKALVNAVKSGLIDTIATDHAPHRLSDKEGGALKAASGMPGVQFSLPLMLTLLKDPMLVTRKMSAAPASIFNIEKRGEIKRDYYADLVLVRRRGIGRKIADRDVVSPCGWTPWAGTKTQWKITRVFINGRDADDPEALGMELAFNNDNP